MGKQARKARQAAARTPAARAAAAADAALEAVWARIPQVNCKGLCWTTCAVIDVTRREHDRILERHAVDLPLITGPYPGERPDGDWVKDRPATLCPALTAERRCSVYADRPTACRIWGSSADLRCMYGCEVIGEPLDTPELAAVGQDGLIAGGGTPYQDFNMARHGLPHLTGDQLRAIAAADPVAVESYRADLARGRVLDFKVARAHGVLTGPPRPEEIAAQAGQQNLLAEILGAVLGGEIPAGMFPADDHPEIEADPEAGR